MTVPQTAYDQRPIDAGKWPWYDSPMDISAHASRQAEARGIRTTDVLSIVFERTTAAQCARSVAVFLGWAEGFRGGSNGDEVWAIVRGACVATVMFRRGDQPATPAALRVAEVVR